MMMTKPVQADNASRMPPPTLTPRMEAHDCPSCDVCARRVRNWLRKLAHRIFGRCQCQCEPCVGCGQMIPMYAPYYQTECGSFCRDCMIDHVHDCDSCVQQFKECIPSGF